MPSMYDSHGDVLAIKVRVRARRMELLPLMRRQCTVVVWRSR